jgi:hypothetical protein
MSVKTRINLGIDVNRDKIIISVKPVGKNDDTPEYIGLNDEKASLTMEAIAGYIENKLKAYDIADPVCLTGNTDTHILRSAADIIRMKGACNVIFRTHTECMMYYVNSLAGNFKNGPVVLMENDGEKYNLTVMEVIRKKNMSYFDTFTGSSSKTLLKEALSESFPDMAFSSVLVFCPSNVSQPFIKQLRELAVNSHVLSGDNIFSAGAALAAGVESNSSEKNRTQTDASNICLIDSGRTHANIYLKVNDSGPGRYYQLASAGCNYRGAGMAINIIPDRTNEIEFLVDDIRAKEPVHEVLLLGPEAEWIKKTKNLSLELKYIDADTPVITVKDTGFTSLYPNTYRVWEQILK